jgi:3-oxoacyl-[acyl-carrier protein] reductase
MAAGRRAFKPGDTFRTELLLDRDLVQRFADFSGDTNAIHIDERAARAYGHSRPVAHGAILMAAISRLIGTEVPGAGAIWMDQQTEWLRPVFIGDQVTVEVSVEQVSPGTGVLTLATTATNQLGLRVMEGRARVKVGETIGRIREGAAARVALVTGASGGIGAAIAARLAKDGLAVAAHYRANAAAADAAVRRIREAGGTASAFRADCSNDHEVERLVSEVEHAHGPIDVVVHAATPGIEVVPAIEMRMPHVRRYLDVYLDAAMALVRSVGPGMSERGTGRLVFIGTSAMHGTPPSGWGGYLVAKHAVWGYVRSLAQELGPSGITANLVSPGLTVTELTGQVSARVKEVEARRNPMRRLASAEDTAGLVGYLAGPEGGFINGADLPVTGGLL